MFLCSPSQNSVPLHLARHAVASTGRLFFEGKSHSRTKGPPSVAMGQGLALGMNLPWKSLCVGGHVVATPSRGPGTGMGGWMFEE